jgi:Flp pilus assembly protein TadG
VRFRRSERGTAAIELPLVLGLVLIPLGLLVLTVPTWVERQEAATEAAAEAARAVVTGTGSADRVAVAHAVASHGLPPGSLRLELRSGGRGQPVTARVTVEIPLAPLPGLGRLPAVDWTATHTERFPDLGEVGR